MDTVVYATQEKFIELAHKWREEYGDMRLEKFFNTENTSTPIMLRKRYIVSSMISKFLNDNGIYDGAKNTYKFIACVDDPEAFAEDLPTIDAEPLEKDTFDYSTVYGDDETDDCECFSRL